MNKKNLLTIWARRAIPALALAATAGVMLPSCEKEPIEKKLIYRAPYEKELFFQRGKMDSISVENVQKYSRDTACKHIYMVVEESNDYTPYETDNINGLRRTLQQRIDLGYNISGRGDFRFCPGLVDVNDSLWFVQNGWTVNRCWQR